MKYIDTDKLITEIERMRKINREALETDHITADVFHGRAQTLNYIFEFINSLQQEQPNNEDIDKVAQELYEHLYELKRRNNVPTNLYDKQEIIDLWKAGIVYGRSHPKQEQPEVDLDTEIHEKAMLLHTAPTYEELEKFAHHFYELGKNSK